jgi:D-alanyl-D-alanine carboxypeptidase
VVTAVLFASVLAAADPAEAGYAAYVVDARTGTVLHQTNGDLPNYPASLTKMMTLYLVFEALETGALALDDRLAVSKHAAARPRSKLGLKRGQSIRLDDAIQALATKSANDVATVIAEHLAGSEERFAKVMTRRAHQLGMIGTTFRNASGLPDPAQRTTARDIAVLARALYDEFPQYTHYFANRAFEYGGRRYRNTNRLLGVYRGMDGIKTGYVNASGYNLAASVHRDGHHIIAVVLGGKTARRRDAQMRRLLDRAFADVDHIERLLATVARPRRKPDPPTVLAGRLGEAAAVVGDALTSYVAIPSARAHDGAGRDWSIQVGAFSRRDSAERALDTAADAIPALLTESRRRIMPVEDRHGILYRARQVDLTKDEARRICETLTRHNLPCMVTRTL